MVNSDNEYSQLIKINVLLKTAEIDVLTKCFILIMHNDLICI